MKPGFRPPGSGSLNINLRTQYPCGYNYNHCTNDAYGGFIIYLNKEFIVSKLPEKLHIQFQVSFLSELIL